MSTTLPARPKTFGNLRHVLESSLAATGHTGVNNELGFRPASRIVIVMIDGLGVEQIKQRAGHAPWLAAMNGFGYSVYPSTTACNITSLATGQFPGVHGILGHNLFDTDRQVGGNMLTGWSDAQLVEDWQRVLPLSQRYPGAVRVVAQAEYQHTGFTSLTMAQAEFVAAESIAERFAAAGAGDNPVTYLYIPELDKLAHRVGWKSTEWGLEFEQIAVALRKFVDHRKDLAVVVTADHGLIDTEPDRKIYLDDYLDERDVVFVGGDSRSTYLYMQPGSIDRALQRLEPVNYAISPQLPSDLISSGWLEGVSPQNRSRLPDLVLMAKSNYTVFHRRFSKPRAIAMVAHHGGLSEAEIRVPLIRFGL